MVLRRIPELIATDVGVRSRGTWGPWFSLHRDAPHSVFASSLLKTVKNLSTVQKTQVQSLGQEDPLQTEMAPYSSFLV